MILEAMGLAPEGGDTGGGLTGYIVHHLTHNTKQFAFGTVHMDSWIVALSLGLLGLLVEDEEAERARRLIAAYNAAAPLPGEEPDGLPGVLLC